MGSRVNLGKVEEDYAVKHNQKRMESEDDYRPLTPMDAPRLPFPMNVNAPQPESPYKPGDGASPDARGSHKRRATLPSIALSPAEANTLTKYWNRGEGGSPVSGPLPQPSDPAPDADHEAGIPAPLIGLAITSNSIKQKRRSRSADALHEMALQHGLADLPLRRRSAEIKYWRSTNRGIPEELDEADAHRSFAATVQEVGAFSDDDSDDDVEEEDEGDDVAPHVIVATAVSPDNDDVPIPATDDEAPSRPASDLLAAAHADHSPPAPRAPAASPELATMDRVDQRLSQIEFNMAQLAHSMQVLTVDRGLAAPAGPEDRRPSFKLEPPPAPKAARSSLEQQPRPQSRRATPSLSQREAAATATAPANTADSPASGGGGVTAGSPSPAVLVARSVSLKAAPSSRLPRAPPPAAVALVHRPPRAGPPPRRRRRRPLRRRPAALERGVAQRRERLAAAEQAAAAAAAARGAPRAGPAAAPAARVARARAQLLQPLRSRADAAPAPPAARAARSSSSRARASRRGSSSSSSPAAGAAALPDAPGRARGPAVRGARARARRAQAPRGAGRRAAGRRGRAGGGRGALQQHQHRQEGARTCGAERHPAAAAGGARKAAAGRRRRSAAAAAAGPRTGAAAPWARGGAAPPARGARGDGADGEEGEGAEDDDDEDGGEDERRRKRRCSRCRSCATGRRATGPPRPWPAGGSGAAPRPRAAGASRAGRRAGGRRFSDLLFALPVAVYPPWHLCNL